MPMVTRWDDRFRGNMADRKDEGATDWGKDSLSEFCELASMRLSQTHAHLRGSWGLLVAFDQVFVSAADHLNESQHWLEGVFLLRAHSAFRAGVRLAGSGQIPETYMVLRGSLELALYALFLAGDPERERRWLTRSDTPENRKHARKEFTAGAMLRHAELKSARIGTAARALYEQLIDYGGHPNDLGLAATASMEETETKYRVETTYIAPDGLAARLALKTAARVALCALWIFGLIFSERFALLGLLDQLEKLSSQGL
jgi:hypothetical protein